MKTLLAFFRLSSKAVCEASASMGHYDFHDYPDLYFNHGNLLNPTNPGSETFGALIHQLLLR